MKIFLLYVFLFFGVIVSAQIEIESEPYSLQNPINEYLSKSMERTISPDKSIEAALVEDELDKDNGIPPRFGLKQDTYLNPQNSGTWIDLPNKDKLWVMNIKSPGAKSINLIYDSFHLPPGGMLHIYNADKSHIIGAFTELNNKGTLERPGKFATGLVYGDDITLEYYHPSSVKQLPTISVSGVIHGYRYIDVTGRLEENLNESGGYGSSGSCQVDINCAEGNTWQNEKRGIAMMLINSGQRWCTGSLVNNTSRDGTPYFLTADHCLDQDNLDAQGNTNASQYMFYWNYERPGCNNGGAEPTIRSTTGAILRANRADSDFALFQLYESPASPGNAVWYNGWDRTTIPTQGGIGIHHPSGDVKKIATHNMVPGAGVIFSADNHWRVNWIATANGHSVTEGGSSGSPLFMNNRRIIGQLHGGSSINCQAPALDPGEYGRFHVSWNGTASTRRLRDWLDPFNTGEMGINGQGTFSSIAGEETACSSPNTTYTLTLPPASITWQFPTNLLTQVSISGSNITLRAKDIHVKGYAIITARNSANNAIIRQRQIYVGKPDTPYGNIAGSTSVSYGSLQNYNYYSTVPGATTYDWWLPHPFISNGNVVVSPTKWTRLYNSGTTKNLKSQVGPNNGMVQFMGVNKCGTSGAKTMSVSVNGGGGPIPLMVNMEGFDEFNFGTENVIVYPNPTSGVLRLAINPNYRESLSGIFLFDFNGRLVFHSSVKSLGELDVSSYPSGIYTLNVKNEKETVSKLVIIDN